MSRRKHWSEVFSCQCGKTFRSYVAEAIHRHNFPALCRRNKRTKTMIDHPTALPAKAPALSFPVPFDYLDVNLIGADESAVPALKHAGFSVMSARVEPDGDTTIFVARLLPPLGPADPITRLADRFKRGTIHIYRRGAEVRSGVAWLGDFDNKLANREFIEP